MNIQVLHTYGSRRVLGSNKIAPGFYESEDPALFGLAEYLLENGHAIVVGSFKSIPHGQKTKETSETGAISSLADLRQQYKTLAGKTPFPAWKEEELQKRIANLQADLEDSDKADE
jgi:hypothetical protein